ncbi:MAG TPA: hypothetical protein ENG87_05070 [Candidatus Pacearchaeota archaeon]|nr:hypothetical protein [Candidatus Pacearchaeota archaeon]
MEFEKDEIIIRVSKTRAALLTFIATGLFLVSIWALTKIAILPSGFDKVFLLTVISLLIIVFGLSIFSGLKKLIDSKQGLIIRDSGIKINIGPNQGQFIEWKEIIDIKIHNQIQGAMFLLIFIKEPKAILTKSSGLKKIRLKMNNKSNKTPVSITSTWLEYNLLEIIEIIEVKIKKTVPNKKYTAFGR